jgi:bifunctional non-homologous end joining protein LigD
MQQVRNNNFDPSCAPLAKPPQRLRPMLATPIHRPFRRAGWIFEVKWDGYRAIAEVHGTNVRMHSRNGNDLSRRFPDIINPLTKLGHDAVLDGELVVLDAQGIAHFQWLQDYPSYGGQLVYYVFDLLFWNGHDLTKFPLLERKRLLRQIVPENSRHVRYCDHVEIEGEMFFEAIKRQGVEGMIAKDAASPYTIGRRSKRWLKIKAYSMQQALIAGYKEGEGSRQKLGSLVLGVQRDGALVHIGEVGSGLSDRSVIAMLERLKPLVQKTCPFDKRPKIVGRVHWVRPELRCSVKYQDWTADGRLRHPVWIGLEEELGSSRKSAGERQA